MDKTALNRDGYRIQYSDQETDYQNVVHEGIKSLNDQISPYHARTRKTGTAPLQYLVFDEHENFKGGLIAWTYWDIWLDIDDLWLAEDIRKQGLGVELMALAEKEARSRGCKKALVKTFSFQAPSFYQKLGYRVIGEIEDYPPGASFLTLQKDL